MKMPTCTTCEQECEQGSSFVAVVEQEGLLTFRWGCEHHPIGDAVAYFGSQQCLEDWLEVQPNAKALTVAWNFFLNSSKQKVC